MAVAAPVVAFAIVLILIVIVVGLVLWFSRHPTTGTANPNPQPPGTFGSPCNSTTGPYCNTLVGLQCPGGAGNCVPGLGSTCTYAGANGTMQVSPCTANPYAPTTSLVCDSTTSKCLIPKGGLCALGFSAAPNPCQGSTCVQGVCT